ncbi:MAG: hypothetical protein HUK14_08375 [Muribaculaceae bacterium]|nr:hypothetical protein [Muribaculaceae bacterium]
MKLKPFFLILPLVASLSALAYDFEIDGIYYSKLSDGYSVSVTNSGKSTPIYGGDIVIPSSVTYDNLTYDVTEIADNAFFN